jgi:hypothetical protein
VAESYEELEDAIEAIWENLTPYAIAIVADTGALPCEFVSAVARLISTQSPTLQPITDAPKTEVAKSAVARREPGFYWVWVKGAADHILDETVGYLSPRSGLWTTCGSSDEFCDDHFAEIGERVERTL